SHVPLQTRKPIATVATPMLDFTGLGILQEALQLCLNCRKAIS
ncbi:hypothetical protein AAKU61_004650, partial [Undibacterium sp. GrIS 1.2]